MKEVLKFFAGVAIAFAFVFGVALFNGWVLYEVYELGIRPIVLELGGCPPHLNWVYFTIIPICVQAIIRKDPKDKYDLNDLKLWVNLLGVIVSKSTLVFMLYIINIMCF